MTGNRLKKCWSGQNEQDTRDEANRLVYDIDAEGNIRIMSCRGHYKDK